MSPPNTDGPDAPSVQEHGEKFTFDPAAEDLAVDIVEAVASVGDEDATDFEPQLNDAIDPDALTTLLHSANETFHVAFSLGSYRVALTAAGAIYVSEL